MNRICAATVALVALLVSACTSHQDDEPMASAVTMTNQWASSAESGMTAVFGTLANAGHHEARIVSGSSPAAGHVEVHEVVPDPAGGNTMRPRGGGIAIPPGGTSELIPGGDHLMLMDLKQPLKPGDDVTLTIVFADGSTLSVTAQIRDFAGGNEEYTPGAGASAPGGHQGHG